MDRMTEYELSDILENLQYTDINSWEQARAHIYVLSSMFSKKKLKVTDIMKFAWEKDNEPKTEPLPTTISDADIERLRKKAQELQINSQI